VVSPTEVVSQIEAVSGELLAAAADSEAAEVNSNPGKTGFELELTLAGGAFGDRPQGGFNDRPQGGPTQYGDRSQGGYDSRGGSSDRGFGNRGRGIGYGEKRECVAFTFCCSC
jgi:hypothetical protein